MKKALAVVVLAFTVLASIFAAPSPIVVEPVSMKVSLEITDEMFVGQSIGFAVSNPASNDAFANDLDDLTTGIPESRTALTLTKGSEATATNNDLCYYYYKGRQASPVTVNIKGTALKNGNDYINYTLNGKPSRGASEVTFITESLSKGFHAVSGQITIVTDPLKGSLIRSTPWESEIKIEVVAG